MTPFFFTKQSDLFDLCSKFKLEALVCVCVRVCCLWNVHYLKWWQPKWSSCEKLWSAACVCNRSFQSALEDQRNTQCCSPCAAGVRDAANKVLKSILYIYCGPYSYHARSDLISVKRAWWSDAGLFLLSAVMEMPDWAWMWGFANVSSHRSMVDRLFLQWENYFILCVGNWRAYIGKLLMFQKVLEHLSIRMLNTTGITLCLHRCVITLSQ